MPYLPNAPPPIMQGMVFPPQDMPSDPAAQALGTFPYQQEEPEPPPTKKHPDINKLNAWFEMTNIAEEIPLAALDRIGNRVVDDFDIDKESRKDWEDEQEAIETIATMTTEMKYWAGRVVSNVKYPMIMSAAIHFASRCYPEIVKGSDVVKCKVVGKDPDGAKATKAARVGSHMSYQLLEEMDWEGELDQLLISYPITGSIFKKTYYCQVDEKNVSELVMAKDLVVNYWAKSIEKAERATHVIQLTPNEIIERINSGVFLSGMKLSDLGRPDQEEGIDPNDDDAPHVFLEQHRWWDLDEDGYQEPYIIMVHKATRKVVRICARYDLAGIKLNDAGGLKKIVAVCYFTHFKFMPSGDGSFYGLGFGKLLFGGNAAVNSITNQLIDAGTTNNRTSGFIGRGIQIGRSPHSNDGVALAPGEWKMVPSTGDDIRKNIVQMPSKEPSNVLFTLLQFLIETGKELASISDILSGESPGPNVPAASTLALIEQGMKIFTGIFKRLFRGLKEEFKKVSRLNSMYLQDIQYFMVTDDEMSVTKEDYSETSLDLVPVADPGSLSNMGRAMKMQALMGLLGQGFNDDAIRKRYLLSLEIENPEELLDGGPPPIDPKTQAEIDLLAAQKKEVDSKTVESSVRAQFSAMQAAAVAMQTQGVASVADALLLSAGFVDRNLPPIIPQGMAVQPAVDPMIQRNTSPQFPALPATGAEGMGAGIETNRIEGIPGRAMGGPVRQGLPYMVGEEGQEVFVPDRPGTVVPNIQTILEQNKDKNFIQRAIDPGRYPFIKNQDGSRSSHKMMSGEYDGKGIVFPSIIQDPKTQELIEMNPRDAFEHALKNNQFVQFDDPRTAEWFSKHYKDGWKK